MTPRKTLVVAGHGMVAQRLLEQLAERDAARALAHRRVLRGTSRRLRPGRALLLLPGSHRRGPLPRPSRLLRPRDSRDPCSPRRRPGRLHRPQGPPGHLGLGHRGVLRRPGPGHRLVPLRAAHPGQRAPGCFVYRTLDDLDAIEECAAGCRRGAVVGGGLLGLEAANALRSLGLETHVVEFAPRLMPVQVDDGGGAVLRRRIEELGVDVHTGMQTTKVLADKKGRARGLRFADDEDLDVDIVVFSAGIRPRDELARAAGLEVGERGGIVVDEGCRTSDPSICAIGECALVGGRIYGLVAPGYQMARVLADRLCGGDATFTGADMSTKLKLMGVDVASFGDAFGAAAGSESIIFTDPVERCLQEAGRGGRRRSPAGSWWATPPSTGRSRPMARGDMPTPEHPGRSSSPATGGGPPIGRRTAWPAPPPSAPATTSPRTRSVAAIADGTTDIAGTQGVHQGGDRLRRLRAAGHRDPQGRAEARPASRSATTCASTSPTPARSCSTSCGVHRISTLLRAAGLPRHGPGLRDLQAGGGRSIASLSLARPHPRRRAGHPPGHQRPLPGQPAAERHLLGGAPGARRRDHPGPAHRPGRGGQGVRPLHQDHRRPAHRPVRRPGRAAAPHLAARWSTPAWSRATPTARPCGR